MPVPVEIMNRRLPGVSASSTSVPVDFWRISTVSPGTIFCSSEVSGPSGTLIEKNSSLLVPARAGDRIGAEDRLLGIGQADHHELAGAEAEASAAG